MKYLISLLLPLSLIPLLVNVHPAYGQTDARHLLDLVARMEKWNRPGKTDKFYEARDELSKAIFRLGSRGESIPVQHGAELAERLIAVFEERKKFDLTADHLPIKVAGRYGSGAKVERYLKEQLSKSGEERDLVLHSIAWTKSLRGNAKVYAALNEIYERAEPDRTVVLATMIRIDRDQSLPSVIKEVRTAKDVQSFNKACDLVSQYRDASLLRHVLPRVKEFPAAPWATMENPTLGITPELLLEYLMSAEGTELEDALSAVEMSVDTALKAYPVLRSKLPQSALESRKAIAKSLHRLARAGALTKAETASDLQQIAHAESDKEVRQRLEETVKHIRQRLERGR